jgi:hypothetical protein
MKRMRRVDLLLSAAASAVTMRLCTFSTFKRDFANCYKRSARPGSMIGIELGRVCGRRRVTSPALSVARWVHNSAVATFSELPLGPCHGGPAECTCLFLPPRHQDKEAQVAGGQRGMY